MIESRKHSLSDKQWPTITETKFRHLSGVGGVWVELGVWGQKKDPKLPTCAALYFKMSAYDA